MPNDAFAAGIGDYRIVTTLCPGGKERMRRLMEMVRHKCADLTPLLTHTFTLDQIAEAYKLFGDKHHGSQPRRSPWASNKSRSEAAGGVAFQEGLLPRKLVPNPVEIHVGPGVHRRVFKTSGWASLILFILFILNTYVVYLYEQ
jgi:hypothetical protein